jgi:hypothetical protein
VDDSEVQFDEHGPVPCVAQDGRTGQIPTLADKNAEALADVQRVLDGRRER